MIPSGERPQERSTSSAAASPSIAKRISVGPETRVPVAANANVRLQRRWARILVGLAVAAVAAGLAIARVFA